LESGRELVSPRLAFETWGTLNDDKSNAVLVMHALTGDSHAIGSASKQHPTEGWWNGIIGPGLAIDTDRFYVVAPNMLGGCEGSTEVIGIHKWHSIIGGSMGGMHTIEWAIMFPEAVERVAIIAAPPVSTADQIALNSVQIEAIEIDPNFVGGDYYDAKPGNGPHRGLALARRMALLNYRSPHELNERFERTWQSGKSPLGDGGRFAVESYLDFHGNKFTRRFDANSYITLVNAMNSHDVGRDRDGVEKALKQIKAKSLVVGISTDRLFPLSGQQVIAEYIGGELVGGKLHVIDSEFGHDGFLIEMDIVGPLLEQLLNS
jgi:homoserine O-acetyltransferase